MLMFSLNPTLNPDKALKFEIMLPDEAHSPVVKKKTSSFGKKFDLSLISSFIAKNSHIKIAPKNIFLRLYVINSDYFLVTENVMTTLLTMSRF